MIKEPRIRLLDLAIYLSETIELISPSLSNHHRQVAYIAFSIALEMGLPARKQRELALAGVIHDIGILSLEEGVEFLVLEEDRFSKHSEIGYLLVNMFPPLSGVAKLVRYHHHTWPELENLYDKLKIDTEPFSLFWTLFREHILELYSISINSFQS